MLVQYYTKNHRRIIGASFMKKPCEKDDHGKRKDESTIFGLNKLWKYASLSVWYVIPLRCISLDEAKQKSHG